MAQEVTRRDAELKRKSTITEVYEEEQVEDDQGLSPPPFQ